VPISSLVNTPCTLLRRASGDRDDFANEQPDEDSIETVVEIQQTRRQEHDDQGETSDTTWTLFFLPNERVRTGDAVVVGSEKYEITGEPWRARNPRTQAVSHIEATARRTAGTGDEVGS
jgi:hypothetical protein